jgi:hypothetical protein
MKIIISIHLPGCSNTEAAATDIQKGVIHIGITFEIAWQRQRFYRTVCHECAVFKMCKTTFRIFNLNFYNEFEG